MKLTSKGRYAVTAMLDLAFHSQTGPVTLSQISERQGISLSYLEQLFTRLRKNGLVVSTRGPGGGYSLIRPAERVAVADIISAVDEAVGLDNTLIVLSADHGQPEVPGHLHERGITHCDLNPSNVLFDPQRVVLSSVFNGVTAGLAIQASTR